ncbi:MAG: hypothetical protein ACLRXQ_11235 [Phascolarctobacterium faecium]
MTPDTIKQKFIAEEAGSVLCGQVMLPTPTKTIKHRLCDLKKATIWADTFVIPSGAKNKALAENSSTSIYEPKISAENY